MDTREPQRFLPTRQSLLSRLRSWDDQDSWREFFETYWRLIYDVATKSGLNDAEAQDVVQETILAVAKQLPGFRYDPSRGQFKSWLRHVARRRILDHLRLSYRDPAGRLNASGGNRDADEAAVESLPDPASGAVDTVWDQEWEHHMAQLALDRVKHRINPEHFQIFELFVVQGWPASKVAEALEVSIPLVYVTRHRVASLLKKEVKRLSDGGLGAPDP